MLRTSQRLASHALVLSLVFALCGGVVLAESVLRVARLECEQAVNPLGVDRDQPRLSWIVRSGSRGARQTAYQILVADSQQMLHKNIGNLWDSGKVVSDETLRIKYNGEPLPASQQAFWKVRSWDHHDAACPWSEPATWTMGLLQEEDWAGQWIVAPWSSESVLLRKEFEPRPSLERALVHVCGLGHFEMFINGNKSGNGLLAPGWSKYNRTALYETHDITEMLSAGPNAIGLVLGNGMYHVERRNRFSKFQGTFGPLRAIVHIELRYKDGTTELVGSDDSWKVNPGAVTFNDVFGGEDYDARRAQQGWSKSGFDDAGWEHAVLLVRPKGRLRGNSASAPPIVAIESIQPAATTALSVSRDVIDLGQNASFMPRVTISGPEGSRVRLTHAEVLHEDGTINRRTCGGNRGPAYWQYTKGTDEPEVWFPQFFYAGCRYLQVDKFPAESGGLLPALDRIEGVVVHSNARAIGQFECSNDLLNRIRTLVRWAQRSNMVSVLTDCPHREKLGWLEQYHLNGPAIRYEFDVRRIFNKGMRDMADSQLSDGLIPNIAPEYVEFPGTFRAAAEWGAASILVPWQQYRFTGDTSLMVEHFDTMQKYMEYLASKATGFIVDEGLGDWYDLGPAERPGAAQLTPPEVTATAFYYHDARIMSRIAALIGRGDEAQKYSELAEHIRHAWVARFRQPDTGTYATGSQCSNAIALVLDLAEPGDRQQTLAALVKDVEDRGHAMTAGDVGFRFLLQALAQAGRSDVIYAMINQDERPGYGYQIRRGATSLTEAWDANHKASHNHFMLGHITEWFYKDLAGIDCHPDSAGFKKIQIKPTIIEDLQWAGASYDSVRGTIRARWELSGNRVKLAVTVPANTTATVFIPTHDPSSVTEGNKPAADHDDVRLIEHRGGMAICEVLSGTYEFAAARAP